MSAPASPATRAPSAAACPSTARRCSLRGSAGWKAKGCHHEYGRTYDLVEYPGDHVFHGDHLAAMAFGADLEFHFGRGAVLGFVEDAL